MEAWKPVVGHEGEYEVSDQGRVRSLDRERVFTGFGGTVRRRVFKGKVLEPVLVDNGYWVVCIPVQGKPRNRYIHRLVLEAFVGPCPPGMEALHDDDRSENNKLANLSWGTSTKNKQQMWQNYVSDGKQGRVPIKSLME